MQGNTLRTGSPPDVASDCFLIAVICARAAFPAADLSNCSFLRRREEREIINVQMMREKRIQIEREEVAFSGRLPRIWRGLPRRRADPPPGAEPSRARNSNRRCPWSCCPHKAAVLLPKRRMRVSRNSLYASCFTVSE